MKIKDRIRELRRVPAKELLPNPRNWRTHSLRQREALQGVLAELGYCDALLARETPEGLMLLDGHLRAETTPDHEVPVLVLDVTEEEGNKLLATLDPLAALAGADQEKLDELLAGVSTANSAVAELLASLAAESPLAAEPTASPPEEFTAYGEDLETSFQCPKCGYQWSGQPR